MSFQDRNFGVVIAVQDLRGIYVWNFVRCSPFPKQKSWRRHFEIDIYEIDMSV